MLFAFHKWTCGLVLRIEAAGIEVADKPDWKRQPYCETTDSTLDAGKAATLEQLVP
jgi:hypothetical protein